MNQDYYQTLGVSKNASDAEIKAAYRKQALQWHPDRNKSPQAAEKFKEINEAYEVLSNPQKRQTYDQFGKEAFSQNAGGPQQGPFTYTYQTYGNGQNPFEGMDFGGFSDPFEIFEQFFGGGSFAGRRSAPRRQVYSLSITFMEAAKGTEKRVTIGGRTMTIKIPAGVDNGSRVRFGDFDVVLSVGQDKTFQRDGVNVYVDAEVDFADAALGTTLDVPTIDGPVTLKVPAGTQPDTVIRLRGRGIPEPHGSRAGDEYVRIRVRVPTKLSRDQKETLESLRGNSKRSGWF
ncbi:MAG: DnaJ domain-containing protein [Patescibacteria group bacterium]|nr:DnaJ domain-containing protein [Patescibacteria group bacterium]MCL5431807.1 DnaJ domain-containing protein [Patescibacteria group bacterium]